MPLTPGARLGPYDIRALLGVGGMGEVYRAHDITLARDVALKVLPDAFALDPDRLARFRREAQVLAALNHPHIAAIYGFEESHGTSALVLELVEGLTLADRLAHGALPLDDALAIAAQIAEALEAAHAVGIIHRDLKPSNVKVRDDGTVKVLDFGLAKALDPVVATAPGTSQSPTLMSPAATRIGMILGTAAYMSPEQARGRAVDKRSDVWAFGCVVYEMLTGQRPFDGEDVSSTIARVLERDPDWSALAAVAPPQLERLVRRCLQKDPQNRLRDIGDARLELREAQGTSDRPAAPAPQPAASRNPWLLGGVLAIGIVAGVLAAAWLPRMSAGSPPTADAATVTRLRTEISLPADTPLALDSVAANVGYDSTLIDLSPDGRTLVYVGMSGGTSQLFARPLDAYEIRPLAGTEGAIHPFFSPDGRSLGFLTNDKVKTYSFATGTTSTLGDAEVGVVGTWTDDDQIFIASEEGRRLLRLSPHGGPAAQVEGPRDGYRYGRVTPDGKQVLVTMIRNGIGADFAQMILLNLATHDTRTLITNGYDARLTSTGYLVFGRSGRVFAARFDRQRQQIVGEPVPIAAGVRMHALYPHLQLALSSTGLLVYVPGGDVAVAGLAWVDRQNHTEFLSIEPGVYGMFDLSNDGRRLAIQVADNKDYIVIYDLEHRALRRLVTPDSAGWPKWSPTGDALAYTSFAEGKPYRILIQQIDSDRPPLVVAESRTRQTTSTWTASPHQITFYEFPGDRLAIVPLSADGSSASPPQYVNFAASTHAISNDGRWLAYAEGGLNVRPLPVGERVQKIADAGTEPRWCQTCNELIYRNGNRWFSAQVRLTPSFEWAQPRLIIQTQFNDSPGPSWALSPDGQRILVAKRKEDLPRTRLNVVHGWPAELAVPPPPGS
jgi:eukaryotic-like serine/threonine-protein kinase